MAWELFTGVSIQQLSDNMDLFNAPLEELVSEMLSDKIIEAYDQRYFKVLTAYSFEKTNLKVHQHYLPVAHISGVLDGFARNDSSFDQGFLYFNDPTARLESAADNEALLSFCDTVLFFSGLMPEAFTKKMASKGYYEQLAVKGFYALHKRSIGDSYFSMMAHYFPRYRNALGFMRQNLLADNFSGEEEWAVQ